jgi:hypothetical protein
MASWSAAVLAPQKRRRLQWLCSREFSKVRDPSIFLWVIMIDLVRLIYYYLSCLIGIFCASAMVDRKLSNVTHYLCYIYIILLFILCYRTFPIQD